MAMAWDSWVLSMKAAALATLLAAPAGAALGWATARWRREPAIALHALQAVPAPVLVYCLLAGSPSLLWLGLLGVVSAAPLVARSVAAGYGERMSREEMAARSLGVGEWDVLTKVIWPVARRAAWAALTVGFARVLAESVVGLAVRR